MKNKMIYTFILLVFSLVLSSCGSNSKPDGGSSGALGTVGLSIAYESTDYDATRGFIDHYRVHATDANGKPIAGLTLEKSIINGVKKIRNTELQINKGGIESSTPIHFFDNGIDFSQTGVHVGDNLIVIPSSGKTDPSYLGDWTIKGVGSSLTLAEGSFNLESTNGLTYIIGNEQRFLGNSGSGRIATAHIETPASAGATNADGFSYFDVVYDPVLGNHTVAVGVHTSGDRKSAGKVVGLRGGEIGAETVSFLTTGGTYSTYMTVFISFGGGATEYFIDQTINPNSIIVEPANNCRLNVAASNLHTNGGGGISIVIDTQLDADATEPLECTVNASSLSTYFEY